jgi:hypothetical protein
MAPERLRNGKNECQKQGDRYKGTRPSPDAQDQQSARDDLQPGQYDRYPVDGFIRQKSVICNIFGELARVLDLVQAGNHEDTPQSKSEE